MGKTKTIILSSSEKSSLEKSYRFGSCHRFRMRCKAVLMYADKTKVDVISEFVGYGKLAIYDWLKRYRANGLDGLREKGGRGPQPLMDSSDTEAVKSAVMKHRLSIKTAKAEWDQATGKKVSDITFRRFLDLLAQDISV